MKGGSRQPLRDGPSSADGARAAAKREEAASFAAAEEGAPPPHRDRLLHALAGGNQDALRLAYLLVSLRRLRSHSLHGRRMALLCFGSVFNKYLSI